MISNYDFLELSKVELKEIDKSKLKELTEITIDKNIPLEERFNKLLEEIGNPFCFLVNGTPVKIVYNDSTNLTLDDCLYKYLTEKRDHDYSKL